MIARCQRPSTGTKGLGLVPLDARAGKPDDLGMGNPLRCDARANVIGLLLASIATLGASARAQTRDDGGLWAMWLAQGDFGALDPEWKRVRWWFDAQARYREDGEQLDAELLRPAIGYALSPRVTFFVGYLALRAHPADRDEFFEHRPWQQLTWNAPTDGFTLQSRTRLEERFVEDQSETGWRLRQFFKLTTPLSADRRLFASVYDEAFFDLNDTRWGQDPGLRQNRAFLGLGWFFDEAHHHSLEVGYLSQWLDRPDEDRLNHILSINLFSTF